ncbi:glycoside hydrolase family 16 protein [Actinocorallia longicatena]|uniref:GH16 domain-containing protein n=1 Tax=Actinocorallia longicatena TaxID=111803 RepID=A0ABP6QHF0_9ACTN
MQPTPPPSGRLRRPFLGALLGVGSLGLLLAPSAPATAAAKPSWKLAWHQEFNGKGLPSAKIWNVHNGNGVNGYGHKALQWYTAKNVLQNGKGQLELIARKQANGETCWYGKCAYTSGRIDTRGLAAGGYGRYSMRAKLPTGNGLWPAFWLQTTDKKPANYGEIDVVETIGNEPRRVQGFAHDSRKRVGAASKLLGKPLSSAYHVYSVDWTTTGITWSVDGRVYGRMKKYKGWTFNKRFFLILNLQVGGEWPGAPTPNVKFPKRMTVDWIRLYKRR